MHTISTSEDGGGFRATCSCGWTSNRYGTREQAQSMGYSHKEQASGDPRQGYDPNQPYGF